MEFLAGVQQYKPVVDPWPSDGVVRLTSVTTSRRAGRPRAASRELLEEAACELFLERGYAATSVADITERAGVSRSTFFNYVEAKSDLLWARFDDAVEQMRDELAGVRAARSPAADDAARAWADAVDGVRRLAGRLPPDNVALAFAQSDVMGLGEELRLAAARRVADVRDAVGHHLVASGLDQLSAEVGGAALAGALLAAVRAWAVSGAGRTALAEHLDRALTALPGPPS